MSLIFVIPTGSHLVSVTVNKGWTDEARAKALEARRAYGKGEDAPVIRRDQAKVAAKLARRAKFGVSEKASRAMANHKHVGADIQRYAEEHNEAKFAKDLGGLSLRDNEPVDVIVHDKGGQIRHGVELKTMTNNSNSKITMKRSAVEKKMTWAKKYNAHFHTVVFDDSKVKDAKGAGKHDVSQRKIYYRRGAGSFRVGSMHPVRDIAHLKELMGTKTKDLPGAARPSGYYPRIKE